MLALPNSAPDSFTPKYVNLVREPGQTEDDGALLVLVAVWVVLMVEVGWRVEVEI